MKVHGRECFKESAVKIVKGCYKAFFGFRNKKVIDDVAQSSFSDVGLMPHCDELRYEK